MKQLLLLSITLLVTGSSFSVQALTSRQQEIIGATTAIVAVASIGFLTYKALTNPTQPNNVTQSPLVNTTGPHWMSMQPRFQQGAVNFQKATAFPFQGAFNLH